MNRRLAFQDFVTLAYRNVLHREPDTTGLSYWSVTYDAIIDTVGVDEAKLGILTSIIVSPEAMGISAADNADGLFYKPYLG